MIYADLFCYRIGPFSYKFLPGMSLDQFECENAAALDQEVNEVLGAAAGDDLERKYALMDRRFAEVQACYAADERRAYNALGGA